MGLDQPLHVQFFNYVKGLTRLDFGRSVITRRPVRDDLVRYFPATVELIVAAFALYLLVGIPAGVIAALTRGRWPDLLIRVVSIIGYAVPLFVTALWLQYGFYFKLGLFPSGERLPVLTTPPERVTGFYTIDSLLAGDFDLFLTTLHHLSLPAMSLAISLTAIAMRFTRASMLNELSMDYVKMARLKGLRRFAVVVKHALRNSLIPVVTITGIQLGYFIGGSVLIETVYQWPGVGFYAYRGILNFDYAPVMSVTLVTSFFFVMINLVIDLLYPILDPRISLTGRR
jgi:peptide/nickel transport system permease protein